MTKEEVRALLLKVLDFANDGDCESAHRLEKLVWEKVLDSIAHGDGDAQALAKEALKTGAIEFSRLYI